jgi:hypothetical protein
VIRLKKFDRSAYATLISWIDTEEMLMQFGGPNFSFPLERKVKNQTWIAHNMVLDKKAWQDYRRHLPDTKYPVPNT